MKPITILLNDVQTKIALKKLSHTYPLNPSKPFGKDADWHRDHVRDGWDGTIFSAACDYLYECKSHKEGLGINKTSQYRKLITNVFGYDECHDFAWCDPDLYNVLHLCAFDPENPHVDLKTFQRSVWSVYAAVLTLMYENEELAEYQFSELFE